jgi:thiamine-phosphate pyrophosphorylase
MKIIAITTPQIIEEDAFLIKHLLGRGIDIIHLRKPDADINECRKLLAQLTQEERA